MFLLTMFGLIKKVREGRNNMFMKSVKEDSCAVYCKCGCCDGVVLKVDKELDIYELSLVSDIGQIESEHGWRRLKIKCKRIWNILRNKEYCYLEICMDDVDIDEFKNFVARI